MYPSASKTATIICILCLVFFVESQLFDLNKVGKQVANILNTKYVYEIFLNMYIYQIFPKFQDIIFKDLLKIF